MIVIHLSKCDEFGDFKPVKIKAGKKYYRINENYRWD